MKDWQQQLEQIEANWGRFEPVMSQPAGQGATVEYRFRNGTAVELEAYEIKVPKLLDDVKAYIKGRPQQFDWQKMNIGDLGYRLVTENQKQYLGEKVAAWRMEIKPRPQHFDKRVTVATPLQKAGAYLLKAQMVGGNTSYIIIWLNDTSIAKKPLDRKTWYFVADAVTGAPVPKANLEFFGWQQRWQAPNRTEILVKDFAEFTDAEGQLIMDQGTQPADFQWLVIATTPPTRRPPGLPRFLRRLVSAALRRRLQRNQGLHDHRPACLSPRPAGEVQILGRLCQVRPAGSGIRRSPAGRSSSKSIIPRARRSWRKRRRPTSTAGSTASGKCRPTPRSAFTAYSSSPRASALPWRTQTRCWAAARSASRNTRSRSSRSTVDAPADPVMLGEKIEAKITAKYYFGSPVTKAKVKYKIERTTADQRWYPPAPWDWLYGGGYWWFAADYDWYPGWNRWGCMRPIPFWWPRPQLPPELVAEREVEIGADGTVKVEIDTAVAKAIHGDEDHSYTITAEVVDASRRTIVGSGNVLVARQPFSVHAWVDRGYFRVGDTIRAGLAARRLDGKPVEGRGELTLLKITYAKGKPVETPVQNWKLDTNAEGQAQQQLTASAGGPISTFLHKSPMPRNTPSKAAMSSRSSANDSTAPSSASIISNSCPTRPNMPRATRSSCKSTPIERAAPSCCSPGRPTAST